MSDHIEAFIDAMQEAGIGPSDKVAIKDDDKINRYTIDGDKPKSENGTYMLKCDVDGFACGWFRSHKEGITHSWHSKAKRGLSDEEKQAHRDRVADARKKRDAEIKAAHDAASKRASEIWAAADKTGTTGYLDRKGCGLNGARIHKGMVAVPMYSDAVLVGLQFIKDDGGKVFLTDVEKQGAYHSMRGPDMSVIRICEGFATGAAIREVFHENPVIVAFDAGNLKPVCVAMRKKYPDANIIICGDNDQWTIKQDGTPWNPGVEKAQQAAVAIGGAHVVVPPFSNDSPDRFTDWDDFLRTCGIDETKEAMSTPDPVEMETPFDGDDVIEAATPSHLDRIRPLGISEDGMYMFFPLSSGMIVTLSSAQLANLTYLSRLVPDGNFWTMHYGFDGEKTSKADIGYYASIELINACNLLGVFSDEDSRGVGVWEDDGKFIVNTGKRIVGDGIDVPTSVFQGEKIYVSGKGVIDMKSKPLTTDEARRLYDLNHSLVWKRDCYAKLLSGWLVVSGVGGALDWRPHIFITGQSGSGKSTVMDNIVKPLMNGIGVLFDGSSTEAGVRNRIGCSSRPFVMDEAEGETMKDRTSMEAIIGLFRKASSGAVIANANSIFNARSCACFAAINPKLKETADKARITLLELEINKSKDKDKHFRKLMLDIDGLINKGFDKRLFKFAFENLDVLMDNIKSFRSASTILFGSARTADQMAPMLAGAYLLTNQERISVEDAIEWINQDDWDWFTSIAEEHDSEKLLTHIMTSRIPYTVHGMRREGSIGDLVEHVDQQCEGFEDVHRGLKAYGVKIEDGYILIANSSPNMARLVNDTPWNPWARTLGDFKDSHNCNNVAVYFSNGFRSKVKAIPLSALGDNPVDDDAPIEVELDF